MKITIYSLPNCPNCEKVKRHLTKKGYFFNEKDLTVASVMAEIRSAGLFPLEAPVLKIDEFYYDTDEVENCLEVLI